MDQIRQDNQYYLNYSKQVGNSRNRENYIITEDATNN